MGIRESAPREVRGVGGVLSSAEPKWAKVRQACLFID